MQIWAVADLHLAKSVPAKNMAVFGPQWEGYMEKIEASWKKVVQPEDLVLLAGDISWAMRLEEAKTDLEWVDALPGTKLMLRGNHDHWWSSVKKMSQVMPPSIHILHNTAFHWKGAAIGGTRLWDTPEYNFHELIHFQENPRERPSLQDKVHDETIFERELGRLRMSLRQMDPHAKVKIAMTHYPPIGNDLQASKTSAILEEFGIEICVFGHLHNVKKERPLFGKVRGVSYHLVACDYLEDFCPLKVFEEQSPDRA